MGILKTLNTLILCVVTVLAMSIGVVLAIVVMLVFQVVEMVADGFKALRRRFA